MGGKMEITSEIPSEAKHIFSNKWVWIIGLGLGGVWLVYSHLHPKNNPQPQSQDNNQGTIEVPTPMPVVAGGGGVVSSGGDQYSLQSQALHDQMNLGLISAGIEAMNSQLSYNATLLNIQANNLKNIVNACVQEANTINSVNAASKIAKFQALGQALNSYAAEQSYIANSIANSFGKFSNLVGASESSVAEIAKNQNMASAIAFATGASAISNIASSAEEPIAQLGSSFNTALSNELAVSDIAQAQTTAASENSMAQTTAAGDMALAKVGSEGANALANVEKATAEGIAKSPFFYEKTEWFPYI